MYISRSFPRAGCNLIVRDGRKQPCFVADCLKLLQRGVKRQGVGLERSEDRFCLGLADLCILAGGRRPEGRELDAHIIRHHAPCAHGHNGQQLLEHRPQLCFALAIYVLVVVPAVAFSCCIETAGGAAEQLCHGVMRCAAEVLAHALVHVPQARKAVLRVSQLVALLHKLHAKIRAQSRLRLHDLPESALHSGRGHGE